MSTTNFGQQKILWKFKTPLDSDYLGQSQQDIISLGVYTGLTVTKIDDTTIEIAPGKIAISDGTYTSIIEFEASHQIPITSSTPYIIVRWEYAQLDVWYADYTTVQQTDLLSTDIIIGRAIFNGAILTEIKYQSQNIPNKKLFEDLIDNLKVSENNPADMDVLIEPGFIVLSDGNRYEWSTQQSVTIPTAHATLPRIDLVCVDETGTLTSLTGVPDASPEAPSYAGVFGLAEVYVNPTVTELYNEDLTDVRSFFTQPFSIENVLEYTDERYYNRNILDSRITDLINRVNSAEKKNLEQDIELSYLTQRQSNDSNILIDMFNDENKSKHINDYLDEYGVEIFNDSRLNFNWKKRDDDRVSYKNNMIRPQKKKFRMETMDRFDLAYIGQTYKTGISRYDEKNECYWMISHEGVVSSTVGLGEITKISKYMKNGEVQVLGRWYLDNLYNFDSSFTNAFYSGIDVDLQGEYLYLIITNNEQLTQLRAGIGKLSINSDGTLGLQSKKQNEYIYWTDEASWNSTTSDFNAVDDLTQHVYLFYRAISIWDNDYVAILRCKSSSYDSSPRDTCDIVFIEQDHNPATGTFSVTSPRAVIEELEQYICYDSTSNEEISSYGMYKSGNELWVKTNLYDVNFRGVFKFEIYEDGSNYLGDVSGVIVGGSPVFIHSSERFDVALNKDPNAGTFSNQDITITHDGHMLEMISGSNITLNPTMLVKKALKGSFWAENQVQGELFVGDEAYDSPYVAPNSPQVCMVEIDSNGERYYWTGDYNVNANEVDVYRYKLSDGTYKHIRLIGASWTRIIDFCTNGTDLYMIGYDGANYEVYFGSLSSLVSAMGSQYNISTTIDITSWGTLASGIGSSNTEKLTGIVYDVDADILWLINDNDDKIDTLSVDGVTWTQGVIDLPSPVNGWWGLAYKNSKLYICDYTADNNIRPKIYVIDIDLSTSTQWYMTHIYVTPTLYPNANNLSLSWDGNDLVSINNTYKIFYKQKTLEAPDVMQLNIFINDSNILTSADVSYVSPIVERYWDPDTYTEVIDGDEVSSRVNVPDNYYMGICYHNGDGVSIFHLDKFLNWDENKTSYGLMRYDVRNIRAWHWIGGSTTLASTNLIYGTDVDNVAIEIERDIVFVISGNGVTGRHNVTVVDLKNGTSTVLDTSNSGSYYNGRLIEANDGLGYTVVDNSSLDLGDDNTSVYIALSIKTFTKDDETDYNLPTPTTFIILGHHTNSSCDIIWIKEDENGNRFIDRVINYVTYTGSGIGAYCNHIADSGYVFVSSISDDIYKSKVPIWEILNDNNNGVTVANLSDQNYWELVLEGGVDVGELNRPIAFSRNSLAYKLPTGEWRHVLVFASIDNSGSTAYYGGTRIYCVEDKKYSKIWNRYSTASIIYCFPDIFEDIVFEVSVDGSINGHGISYMRQPYQINKILDTAMNWEWMEEGNGNYGNNVLNNINDRCRPYFLQDSIGTSYYKNIVYNKDFGLLFYCSFGDLIGAFTMRGEHIDECKYETIDFELSDNPKKVHFLQSSIIPNSELWNNILPIHNNIKYYNTWNYIGSDIEVQLEASTNYENGKAYFGNYYGIKKDDGAGIVEGVDYENDQALDDTGSYDLYDDNDSGAFDTGRYFRVINNTHNLTKDAQLNLTPIAKDLSGYLVSPKQDEFYIDIQNGITILPRPSYWSKCESVQNIIYPEIKEEDVFFHDVNGFNNEIGKFGNCLRYNGWIGKEKYLYPFGREYITDDKMTFSFWLQLHETTDNVEYPELKIYFAEDSYILLSNNKGTYAHSIVIDGSSEDTDTTDLGSSFHHIYVVMDKDGGLTSSYSIRVFVDNVETMNTITIYIPDKFYFGFGVNSSADINSWIMIDNIKIWKELVSESASWLYNSGTGLEGALHYIYGATDDYTPNNVQVGYNYRSSSDFETYENFYTDEASDGYFEWKVRNASKIGIGFNFDDDCGIAYVSVYNETTSTLEIDQEQIDTYTTTATLKKKKVWFDLNSDNEYKITVGHYGSHNTSSSSPYTVSIYELSLIKSMNDGSTDCVLKVWDSSDVTNIKEYNLTNGDYIDIIDQQEFDGDDLITEFTLSGKNIAYEPLAFSVDSGSTWYYPDSYMLTWGTNSPNYDDQIVDSNGYFTVKFVEAPVTGTNNVIIKYIPKIDHYKLETILKHPYINNIKDIRKIVRCLDQSIELIN